MDNLAQQGHKGEAMNAPPYDPIEVGKRLEKIRVALELGTQAQLGDRLGVARGRINNWTTGVALIPISYAAKLKEITGVTIEFLYLGDTSSLPLKVADALAKSE